MYMAESLFAINITLMSRNACNGENGETGEKSTVTGDLNWMPKVALRPLESHLRSLIKRH